MLWLHFNMMAECYHYKEVEDFLKETCFSRVNYVVIHNKKNVMEFQYTLKASTASDLRIFPGNFQRRNLRPLNKFVESPEWCNYIRPESSG